MLFRSIDEESNNDADSRWVNRVEKFDADVMEETAEEPGNDADSGRVNGAWEFVANSGGVSHADFMKQTTKAPINDVDQSEELFADLRRAAIFQRHDLFCLNNSPATSNLTGRTARGYAAFVHCDNNAASKHPKDKIAAIVELALHLSEEDMFTCPVQYRWMYPIQTELYALKHHVGKTVNLFVHGVRCTSGCDYGYFDAEIDKMVWFVLNSCDEVQKYREYVIHI